MKNSTVFTFLPVRIKRSWKCTVPYIVGHETRTQIMDGALEHQKLYDAILSNEKMEVHRLVTLHLENARHNICTILKELELTT